MMSTKLNVNQKVLLYYIEKSKVPRELLQLKVKNVDAYLDGSKKPTFNQVTEIAKAINIPTGLLLLNKTIDTDENILSFRTLNSRNLEGMSSELRDTIREMQVKQDFLRGEIEGNLNYVGKFSISDNYLEVVREIRTYLQIPIDYQKEAKNKALDYFRKKINYLGIFVFFNGKVKDNTHRKLDIKEFRGFVLSDKKAPIIFINQKDSKSGQLFTLIHELVHLFIGTDEIYNVIETDNYQFDPTEAFVNKITAEILVPETELRKCTSIDLEELSKNFPVSKFVLVRRLLDMKIISKTVYQKEIARLEKEFELISKESKVSSGNYTNNLNFRMDKLFFQYVENAVKKNRLSYTDAFNIIGVGYKGYKTLSGGKME